MKVYTFPDDDPTVFQNSINTFIADKEVINTKYQSMTLVLRFTGDVPSETTVVGHALIIYEE